MKWHKFEAGFWDSETADLLDQKFGSNGIVIYLRIISAITRDIHTWEDVKYAHENGWTKSIQDWARVAKYRSDSVTRVLHYLSTLGKLTISEVSNSRCNLRLKNLHEFVHRDALSSHHRKSGDSPGGPSGGPSGALRREEIRKSPQSPQQPLASLTKKVLERTHVDELISFEQKRKLAQQKAREFLGDSAPSEPTPLNGSVGGEIRVRKNEEVGSE